MCEIYKNTCSLIEVFAYDPVEMREFLEIKSQRDYPEMIEILVFQII